MKRGGRPMVDWWQGERGGRESGERVIQSRTLERDSTPVAESRNDSRQAAAKPAAHIHGYALGLPDRCEVCMEREERIRELEAELADGYSCHVADHARLDDEKEQAWAEARHAYDRAEKAEARVAELERHGHCYPGCRTLRQDEGSDERTEDC